MRLGFVAISLACLGVASACGSAPDSTFDTRGGSGDPKDLTGGNLGSSGGAGSSGGQAGSSGGAGNVGNVTPESACATSSAGAGLLPSYLVFMYDRSISMDDPLAGGSTTRWTATKAGVEAFFADPTSAGAQASLTFFGVDSRASTADCSALSYVTPHVSMRALPNATDFHDALTAASPSTDTPTLAALRGALQFAKTVKAGLTDGGKVAVVLVTDGQPRGCSGNTVSAVAGEAAASASEVPTYVIGVGPSLTNLADIATGGGTTAIMVDSNNPDQVSADLKAALGRIRAAQLGCDYALPAPPEGKSLDVNAVNVNYTPTGGSLQTLAYSADCADPNGWHYDVPASPKQIVMCPRRCDAIKADPAGQVSIVFGCSITAPPGTALPGGGVK